MRIKRIYAIAEKEVYHIIRDPFTLAMALLLPVMQVVMFGLCIEFNTKNIPIAVYDGDRSDSSRKFVEVMSSSAYFIPDFVSSPSQGLHKIDANKDRAALIINPKFENELLGGQPVHIQVLLDGSDSSSVVSVSGYLNAMSLMAAQKITDQARIEPVRLETRFLYNPELNSRWFTVPGLLVMVLAMLSILLTALTVAREWENGSMELLLSTPVKASEIILGKLLPYWGLGVGAVGLVYSVARIFFDVPFRGNHLVFLLGCSLFLIANLAQGLLISVVTRKQQLAMQLSMQTGFLPSMLLSGFIFPIDSMPPFFQYLTSIFPARWFMEISRSIFLEGSGLWDLKKPFIALSLGAFFLVFLASKKFKMDVEP